MARNRIAAAAAGALLFALCLIGMPAVTAAPLPGPGDAPQSSGTADETPRNEPAANSTGAAIVDPAGAPAADAPTGPDASITDDAAVRSDVLNKYLTRSKTSVYFVRGSLILTSAALVAITENAERLKANPDETVVLIGYVEDLGSQSYNVALAERRTSVVRKALIDMGVPVRQIRSSIVNREPPDTVPCETEICRASYRRVEFAYATPR